MSEINYLEKVENHHLKTLEENGLQLSDLPKELKGEFNVLKFMLKKLENDPTNESQYIALEKKSLLVADKVQDFYEKDFSEEEEEEEESQEEKAEKERLRLEQEQKEKEEADEKARLDQEEKDRLEAEAKEKEEKEKLDKEEQDRLDAEAKEKEKADNQKKTSKKPVDTPPKNEDKDEKEGDDKDDSQGKKKEEKPEEKPKPVDGKFGTYKMEQDVRKILDANDNRISIRELQAIIKKEPDYPEQKVFNLRLRKVLNYSLYREF